MIKELLNDRVDLRKYLFVRGFLLTDDSGIDGSCHPFYGEWNSKTINGFTAWTHKLTGFHTFESNGKTFFIFGHAYDPFLMECEEKPVLKHIAEAYGTDEYFNRINEITGVYVFGVIGENGVEYLVDPSGMQSACSGIVNEKFYMSSHPQLIADICNLTMTEFTKELLDYKWYYRVMGPYLPGDLTPFEPIKRIVPDIAYKYDGKTVTHKRFYPLKEIHICDTDEEYEQVIKESADILKKNMELVSRKWKHPAISLTGGIDSNTTFASANGIYERFTAFSYLSAKKETIDVEAAQKIAGHFNVPWTLYTIPETNEGLKDYNEIVEIIKHNNGYIAPRKDNEYRKRVYLMENLDCDVEVKSWVSETIRCYWYKHYGRKSMPKMSPKLYRNLYKIFIANRKLAHKVDKIFENYIKEYEHDKIPEQYPPADIHYNEVTWGSWGGMGISEMKIYSDITFIYNNRKFLDLMFRVPLEKRISDRHHLDMKKVLNKELYNMNIRVVNMKETDTRAFLLNVIFTINSFLPF